MSNESKIGPTFNYGSVDESREAQKYIAAQINFLSRNLSRLEANAALLGTCIVNGH